MGGGGNNDTLAHTQTRASCLVPHIVPKHLTPSLQRPYTVLPAPFHTETASTRNPNPTGSSGSRGSTEAAGWDIGTLQDLSKPVIPNPELNSGHIDWGFPKTLNSMRATVGKFAECSNGQWPS